jgi:hypothetical protein
MLNRPPVALIADIVTSYCVARQRALRLINTDITLLKGAWSIQILDTFKWES